MSSNEDEYNEGENASGHSKKRRIQRACDICRRKKIRCDGVQMPGNRCSNCISYSFDCTYVEAAKKRGPPKGYVESLENRLERMEKVLKKLCPEIDIVKEFEEGNLEREGWLVERPVPIHPSNFETSNIKPVVSCHPQHSHDVTTTAIRFVNHDIETDLIPHDDDFSHLIIADNLKRMSLNPTDFRFFGKSSGAMLIQTAIELKNEYTNGESTKRLIMGEKRPEFWSIRPWEQPAAVEPANYDFPDDDLIKSLSDLYFDNMNVFLPLLHRPTFEKGIANGLHLKDDMFGATVLLVCAVGSRYSDDRRVLLDGVDSFHSCGWRWFDQVQLVKQSLLGPPSLHDLQFYCLSVQFLQGSSAPQACWTMVGIGIRLAQDVGAHRRKTHNHVMTAEDEMWKRAFWVLVSMDRMVSTALGRPCAIQDEDFDLDFPVECDDEYWENSDPKLCFKQPPDKPSLVTAFVLYLKLNRVLAIILRTIYSINKSKILLGFVGPQWEQHIVAELDSALNGWVDIVPDHLRWDPNREDEVFFNQSAALYSCYYHIQILIHRPFIPSPRKPSPLSFPSLAICTNAARSCSHIVDIQHRRNASPLPHIQIAVFTAGIVLLLNIWGGKRSGLSTDPRKEMADVYKCMQVLRHCEQRWHSAGRFWDILYELACVGELPLPQPSPPATNKRERNADSPKSVTRAESNSPTTSEAPRSIASLPRTSAKDVPMPMAPSQRPTQVQQQAILEQPSAQQVFTLPVYSNELGRLPLHGQVGFSAQSHQPVNNTNSAAWYPPMSSGQVSNYNTTQEIPHIYPMSEMFDYQMASGYSGSHYPSSTSYRNGDVNHALHVMPGMTDPRQPGMVPPGSHNAPMIDSDTIAMWSTAPTGFELDDWGTYLTNVSEITQGLHNGVAQQGGMLVHR